MAEQQPTTDQDCPLDLDSLPHLTNLSVRRMMNLMKQSAQELDDMIAANIGKLDESLNKIRVNMVSKIGNISSSGDGGKGEVPPPAAEKDVMDKAKPDNNEDMAQTPSQTLAYPEPIDSTDAIFTKKSLFSNSAPLRPLVAANSVMARVTSGMAISRLNLHKILEENAAAFRMDTNVNEENMKVVKSALGKSSEITVLDFRTLNNWLEKPSSRKSQHLVMPPKMIEELTATTQPPKSPPGASYPVDFTPPNEFDWFSFETMNSVLPISTANQVFSLVKECKCLPQIKELYINAAPPNDDDEGEEEDTENSEFPLEANTISGTISSLKNLTKLVMRGMCRDELLQSIGRNCDQLTHLDISGSQLVTDVGIQNLVFRERNGNSTALYMIPTWILKNMDKMNPLVGKLTYLDYSLTSVTTITRKIFQLLPGCYLFKRLTSNGEEDDFGHHIFIREPELFKSLIPTKVTPAFQKQLSETVGATGAKTFTKLVESHPWRRYFLTLYSYKTECDFDVNGNMVGANEHHIWGIITPNQNEKRIQGIVQWCDGTLAKVYTIYPINLNLLGSLHTVRTFQGIVHGSWKTQFSLLPDLVQLDIFTEPKTLISFMQFCPNLRRLTIRIRGAALNDDHIIHTIRNSMFRAVLEEFWVAPSPAGSTASGGGSHVSSLSPSLCSSFTSISERLEAEEQASLYELTTAAKYAANQDLDLVQLSLICLKTLVTSCPNLKKVGDLATWSNVEEEELYIYSEQLRQKRHKIVIKWANINLPESSDKKKSKSNKLRRT